MKTTLLLCSLLILCYATPMAQDRGYSPSGAPYQDRSEMLYADDVVISDNEFTDQSHACLSVAFNGWLFTAFNSFEDPNQATIVYRSKDNGATWQLLWAVNLVSTVVINGLDIVVCGNNETDLTVFLAGTHYYPLASKYFVWVWLIEGDQSSAGTQVIDLSFTDPVRDIAIASDYKFPAAGASPYSVGVAFPVSGKDTDVLHFVTSGNGGVTFPNETSLSTAYYVKNVSVAFGRCNSFPSGRYFLAWDEFPGPLDRLGRIYSSYTEPGFSSPLTAAYRLDDTDASLQDKCKNPVISSQFSTYDNDMANLTTVVLFERAWNGSTDDYDILGYFNKESVWTTNWAYTQISNDVLNVFQPDINFDPAYGNFLVTYCDSTNQQLPYVVQYLDMPAPTNWLVITNAYNDNPDLVAPYPKVEINPMEIMTAHVWIRESPAGKGIVMFDAEYNAVGIPEAEDWTDLEHRVSPNPCSERMSVSFYLDKPSIVSLEIFDAAGKLAGRTNSHSSGPGECKIELNVKNLPNGCYQYLFQTGSQQGRGKVMVRN